MTEHAKADFRGLCVLGWVIMCVIRCRQWLKHFLQLSPPSCEFPGNHSHLCFRSVTWLSARRAHFCLSSRPSFAKPWKQTTFETPNTPFLLVEKFGFPVWENSCGVAPLQKDFLKAWCLMSLQLILLSKKSLFNTSELDKSANMSCTFNIN